MIILFFRKVVPPFSKILAAYLHWHFGAGKKTNDVYIMYFILLLYTFSACFTGVCCKKYENLLIIYVERAPQAICYKK